MKASEELGAARDELARVILPAVVAYEKRTGLIVTEVDIDRPAYQIDGHRPILGIKVRTNANSL